MPACVTPGLPLMTPGGDEGPAQAAPGDGTSPRRLTLQVPLVRCDDQCAFMPFGGAFGGHVVSIKYLVTVFSSGVRDSSSVVRDFLLVPYERRPREASLHQKAATVRSVRPSVYSSHAPRSILGLLWRSGTPRGGFGSGGLICLIATGRRRRDFERAHATCERPEP
jgi:hypothetical protein